MGVLAYYLEDEGLATVTVALLRPHVEIIRPPRALWLPFELGRPFGAPNDTVFQSKVLRRALALFERQDGPHILEDFDQDAPNSAPDPDWRCAIDTDPPSFGMRPEDVDPEQLIAAAEAEISAIEIHHEAARRKFGRSAVGLTPWTLAENIAALSGFLRGQSKASWHPDISNAVARRFATDDITALYTEAASAGAGAPNGDQLTLWFWQRTAAGKLVLAGLAKALAGDDRGAKIVAEKFTLPSRLAPKLGL